MKIVLRIMLAMLLITQVQVGEVIAGKPQTQQEKELAQLKKDLGKKNLVKINNFKQGSILDFSQCSINDNNLKNIAKYIKLRKLDQKITNLILSKNQIKDVSSLSDLPNLTILDLGDNQIIDIKSLATLKQLTELNLINNQIKNIYPLRSLPKLIKLNLESNQIKDIAPLENLKQLIELNLGINQIEDINALQDLTQLTTLILSRNSIIDITPLSNLKQLTALYLNHNHTIKNITPLHSLIQLKNLNLSNNQISNVNALTNLINLSTLDLKDNQVKDIKALSKLINLIELNLSKNLITNIDSLQSLISLTKLYLKNNSLPEAQMKKAYEIWGDIGDLSGVTIPKDIFPTPLRMVDTTDELLKQLPYEISWKDLEKKLGRTLEIEDSISTDLFEIGDEIVIVQEEGITPGHHFFKLKELQKYLNTFESSKNDYNRTCPLDQQQIIGAKIVKLTTAPETEENKKQQAPEHLIP